VSRPKKDGLDYFPHDCDASHDEKIEAICALYGKHVGYSIVFRLYERIYRAGGSLNVSAAETMQILSRNYAEMDTETFKKFISSCLNLGIFDKNEYENNHLLTSDGIKRRVKPIIYKREKMAKMYQNQVSASETLPETTQETISETPQSKVKESKVKNISFAAFQADREKNKNVTQCNAAVTQCNAAVTQCNAESVTGALRSASASESESASESSIKILERNKHYDSKIIDKLYDLYPTRDINNNERRLGKCDKNKKQLQRLLKDGKSEWFLEQTIKTYVRVCNETKAYKKDFGTFLNNIPDYGIPNEKPEGFVENKTVS
jgi:hypothetical protein